MQTADSTGAIGPGGRIALAIPYILLLAAAIWLWTVASAIDYPARPGALGPDFWPKAAILMLGVLSVVQILKTAIAGAGGDARGIGDKLADEEEEADETPRSLYLLLAGIALTVGYGLVLETLGFPVATAAFLVAFMYLGGSRKHLAIWISSIAGVALISVLLMRVVYVSLPRGIAPFDGVSNLISGF